MKYKVIERIMWDGTKEWIVAVNGEEIRFFYQKDRDDTIETAYGWAEANGYEYEDTIYDH